MEKYNNPKINLNEIYSSSSDEEEKEKEEKKENGEKKPKYKFYFVKSKLYEDQLDEITKEFKIEFKEEFLYSRCLKCNIYMETFNFFDIEDEEKRNSLIKEIGEKTIKYHGKELSYCNICQKTFWNGWYFEKSKLFAMKHSYQKNLK